MFLFTEVSLGGASLTFLFHILPSSPFPTMPSMILHTFIHFAREKLQKVTIYRVKKGIKSSKNFLPHENRIKEFQRARTSK